MLAIGIALRAVLPGKVAHHRDAPRGRRTAVKLRAVHDAVLPVIEQIRSVADALSTHHGDLDPVYTLLGRLEGELLPHECADEELLVPLVDRALGGPDATAAMSRTHAEIEHQVGRLRRLLDGLDPHSTEPEDVIELRSPGPSVRVVRRPRRRTGPATPRRPAAHPQNARPSTTRKTVSPNAFRRWQHAPPVANSTCTAPGVPRARAAEVRLPKQRRKPVTRLASHRSACPVTHGVTSKTCGSAPGLEGNTCVYDAPTTPRTRRCDEAGNTFLDARTTRLSLS